MSFEIVKEYCVDHAVDLVAVSKTKPIEDIKRIYDQGQKLFGENRVDELVTKATALPEDIHWHFIGTLQTKKVKHLIPHCTLIHSVDSIKLVEEIQKRSLQHNVVTSILLQIKIAKEEAKQGLNEADLKQLIGAFEAGLYPNVKCKGLMGMATFTSDQTILISEFTFLKSWFDQISTYDLSSFDTLSMGMSGDYKLAIEHGSTMVRVGSLIFGSRNYG